MKLYRIGELARTSRLSARTIDYYTNIGLIHPETRSNTNYRLYSAETLARLQRIEELKREKMSLEEIKDFLESSDKMSRDEHVSQKLTHLQLHLQQLEHDIQELKPMMDTLKPSQARSILKHLTPKTVACIEALLILLDKNPF